MQNKRFVTKLKSKIFKNPLFIEIGATNVGSIVQTYRSDKFYKKGEEKGYFALGSTIILLFQKSTIQFERDLLENSKKRLETLSCMGDILGKVIH